MRRTIPILIGLLLSAASVFTQDPELQPPDPLEEEFIQSKIENGESHASGARPELGPVILGNPTTAVVALRVGLYASTFNSTGGLVTEFASLHHAFVELTNTAGFVKVTDQSDGKEILTMAPGSLVRVEHDGAQFLVTQDGVFLGAFDGPVFFRPDDPSNQFQVESIRRTFGTTQRPRYRGAMEVARGATTAAQPGAPKVNLVNILEVEDYVPGVVANESIASFSVEALKAQAIAARGYAIANIGNYIRRGYPFDVVDSSSSQVYRGVISEHKNAVAAASGTYGLVASREGRIISAMYSSSFGGHSESSEWVSFTNSVKGAGVTAYLRGIYDGFEPAPDFSTDAGINFFWRNKPPALPLFYDDCAFTGNGFSRWKFTLPAPVLKGRLTTSNSTLVSGTRSGAITNVEIVERTGAAQRALVARVTLTTGVVDVLGWLSLRQTIGTTNAAGTPRACGSGTILASFPLNSPSAVDVATNADGTAGNLTVYGGGWGHNLGMSQYGAHGRGKSGQTFIEILKAYYSGVDVGSYPIDIGRNPGTGPPTLRQEFAAPNAQGTLQIRASGDLEGLRVHLNELYDLSFNAAELASGLIEVDVSPYLIAGLNIIQYNPVGRAGSATVDVIVR
ncbi:MAG TPA: SpoIID/LytB domain-containing protein [Vicinamibacterales bacterium]|nr:SpoIID/LytB domain-containing protein [Vicinamibacterales bacterium]